MNTIFKEESGICIFKLASKLIAMITICSCGCSCSTLNAITPQGSFPSDFEVGVPKIPSCRTLEG